MITKTLDSYIAIVRNNETLISPERKKVLGALVDFISNETINQQNVDLIFICTHNSRRSHFSQIWAQIAANYYNLDQITCYSGGTETTAIYSSVLSTLSNGGIEITALSEGNNPIQSIKYSLNAHPIIGFSKKFDSSFNPNSRFAAVMTCSHAEENCPFIPEAIARISIPYEDPKISDGTDLEQEKYNEKSLEIATELFYVFKMVTSKI